MKGFKKFAMFALAVVLVFGTVGCGKKSDAPEKQEKPETQEPEVQLEVSKDELFTYEEVEGGVSITGYQGDVAVLNIPEKIGELTVVAISDKAFDAEQDIIEVNIPDSMKKIGERAFDYCKNLKKLNLGKGVEEIEERAFGSAHSLKEVIIPASVKRMGVATFGSSMKLEKVEMQGSMEEIPYTIFCNTKLQTFTVPEGVKIINGGAFATCPELKELYIPASVTQIDERAVEDSPNIIIVGEAGSYAETFAKQMNIPFQGK